MEASGHDRHGRKAFDVAPAPPPSGPYEPLANRPRPVGLAQGQSG